MVFRTVRGTQCIAMAAAVALLAAGAAQAQTTPAPAANPPAAIPAVPVPLPELPASQVAAAHDLVVASGMARSFEPMVPQLSDQIIPLLTRTRPELKQNLSVVLAQLQPEFAKKGEQMVDVAARIYARHMSEQELKDAAAFFSSPVGKRYVSVQPALLDELVVAMQSWTQELSNFMMQRVHDEMKKKGQDF
jgi:hypothetical protein